MGRRKPGKPKGPGRISHWWSGLEDGRKGAVRRLVVWTVIILVLLSAGAMGMKALEARVLTDTDRKPMRALRVRFADLPDWMPDRLADEIEADISPKQGRFRRAEMTKQVFERAARNPWIRKVHRVERKPTGDPGVGCVEVRAEFRRPLARVQQGHRLFYVDADGVRLSSSKVSRWVVTIPSADGRGPRRVYYIDRPRGSNSPRARRIHYVTIAGVREAALPVGKRWSGQDLADGLRLVGLILRHTWAGEITTVDVANHAGRIEPKRPEIVMSAQVGRGGPTEIYFGRFPHPKGDHVVSPRRKLSYLDTFVGRRGRLGGAAGKLDLRHDHLVILD